MKRRTRVRKTRDSIIVTGGAPDDDSKPDERQETPEEKEKREIWETKMCYARLFSSPDGRAVLEDMRKSTGDRSSFVRGDSHATAFNEGLRESYLRVKHIIRQVEEVGTEEPRQKSYIETVTGEDPIITRDGD